jgi:hypothetical protein
MELPIDAETRRRVKAVVTHPMHMREIGLELAEAAGGDLDQVIEAIRSVGPAWMEWVRFAEKVRGHVVERLEKAAESEYRALVLEDALRIMERHPNMRAEEAVALVESTMLELSLAPDA